MSCKRAEENLDEEMGTKKGLRDQGTRLHQEEKASPTPPSPSKDLKEQDPPSMDLEGEDPPSKKGFRIGHLPLPRREGSQTLPLPSKDLKGQDPQSMDLEGSGSERFRGRGSCRAKRMGRI